MEKCVDCPSFKKKKKKFGGVYKKEKKRNDTLWKQMVLVEKYVKSVDVQKEKKKSMKCLDELSSGVSELLSYFYLFNCKCSHSLNFTYPFFFI